MVRRKIISRGLAVRVGRAQGAALLRVDELDEALPQQLVLGSADHRLYRLAGVAAPVLPEDEHEVGGGPDEAAEMRRLPARGSDQGERSAGR